MTEFNAAALIDRLESFAATLPAAVGGVRPADARWRPDDTSWAIVEIVAHLADEEELDFPVRLRLLLEDPGQDWPPIDPEGWARERRYIERDLAAEAERFVRHRRDRVAWARSLPPGTDWSATKTHPAFGSMRAGDLLGAWCDHDALHLRQIAKRLHQLTVRDAAGFDTGYAGEWSA